MSDQKATDAYAKMRTRQHWKKQDAARALADWAQSGESLTAFARRHQLGLHRLQWWRAQLAQQSAPESEPVRLLPVVPRQAPLLAFGADAPGAIRVTVGAARIDISDVSQADPRWLAALIAELRGAQS